MADFNYKRFFDFSPDLLCSLGDDGYFKLVNQGFTDALGWTEKELLSKPATAFIHPEDIEKTKKELGKDPVQREGRYFENRYICKDGSYRVLEWTHHWEKDGTVFSIARDITEHKESANLFELVISSSPISYILCDASGKIELVNEESEKLFGYKHEELIGKEIEMLMPANFHAGHVKERDKFIKSGEQRPMGRERVLLGSKKNGEEFQVEIGLSPIRISGMLKILCTVVDVNERKIREAQIAEFTQQLELANKTLSMQAITDELTGLKNRRSFVDTLELGIYSASRSGRPFSLLILDIDNFKNYNDSYGHPEGDELLKDFSNLISQETRLTDSVSRIGGEEFALTFPDSDKASSILVSERYRVKISDHKWTNKNITASLGISTLEQVPIKGLNIKRLAQKMMKEADKALYEAKDRGKNQVVHFEEIKPN